MALFRDDQGKTEKATPQRLGDVRQKGDTPMSRELLGAGSLVMIVLALRLFGGWLVGAFEELLRHGLTVDLEAHDLADGAIQGLIGEIHDVLLLVAPPLGCVLGVMVLGCIGFGYGQIGFKVSNQVFGLKFEKINPFTNWTKIFNFQAIVRTAFAAVKLLLLSTVLWLVLNNRWQSLAHLHDMDVRTAAGEIVDLALLLLQIIAAVVFVLAAADLFYQRYDFQQRNMMTKQEVEDERKRSEGDPMIKSRLRGARMELLKHRMMEAVPKADVVITNPTHFAVAIRYDRTKNAAPEVVAKGMDAMALRIRELAKDNDVPVMEDPPLARALYRAVRVGQEIPMKFYQAVATVLSHVYRLKGRAA